MGHFLNNKNLYLSSGVFLASLLGSLHCVGMCGGFNLLFSKEKKTSPFFLYHLGRLIAYMTLGSVSGLLGRLFWDTFFNDFLKSSVFFFVSIFLTVGTLLIILKFYKSDFFKPFIKRPFIFGMAHTFIPCGWLYGFLAIATASGSILSGLRIMFFFWLGTLPILILLFGFANQLYKKFQPKIPKSYRYVLPAMISILFILSAYEHARSAIHLNKKETSQQTLECH